MTDVGQRFIVDFTDYEPNNEIRELIADYGVGGVILFKKNAQSASYAGNKS